MEIEGGALMSKKGLAFLVLMVLLGCAIWIAAQPAKAEIAQDFKGELIDQANAIAADAEEFRQLVRTEVSGKIILAKGKATEALALLKRRNGIQTSIINKALEDAKGYITQAQTGVNEARVFKEVHLVEPVQSLSAKIDGGLIQSPSLITQTEAQELKKILNNCLGGCLTDVNLTLVDISKYLAGATKDFEVAQGYLRVVPSPSRSDLLRAKSLVTSGVRKLESAWRGEMRIKDSIKCFIYGLYTFKKTVLLAPLKTSGLALPGGVKVLGTGPGGGPIRFIVLGPGVEALRVQVFDLAGRPIFESGFRAGSTLEWCLLNNRGEAIANGVYLYVVTIKGFDGLIQRSEVRKLVISR
jgi:hypothetical protein